MRRLLMPEIPAEVQDDFIILSATQVQKRARLLFGALLLTTPTAFLASADGASLWVRYVIPVVMALLCLAGFSNLSRDLRLATSVRRSAKMIREATTGSSIIAVMCSAWCVYSWLGAPPESRIYYPVIIALGAFSTAYCLSTIKAAAIANIVINIAPMILLLMSAGDRLNFAVAVSLLVASAFQLHMIWQHQGDIIRLLTLQRHARSLATLDPLTGLLNRRALLDDAAALSQEGPLRLMLVDIDYFKAINDTHGHDTGDDVLIALSTLIKAQFENCARVARIGGEEFAILGTVDHLPQAMALALLSRVRATAMPHGTAVTVSIGIAEGDVAGEAGWRALFHRADAALYAAKDEGRNRIALAKDAPLARAEAA